MRLLAGPASEGTTEAAYIAVTQKVGNFPDRVARVFEGIAGGLATTLVHQFRIADTFILQGLLYGARTHRQELRNFLDDRTPPCKQGFDGTANIIDSYPTCLLYTSPSPRDS